MKYIRTKDNKIIDLSQLKNLPCLINEYLGFTIYDFNQYGRFEAISQAETIEELCDEFVFVGQDNVPILMETLQQCLDRIKDLGLTNYKIYGAIWVQLSNGSWGLKPVAKMNENGELELL